MINRELRTKQELKALNELFYGLDDDILTALEVYTKDLSDTLYDSGVIYHTYDLRHLIDKFSEKYWNDLDLNRLNELHNADPIGCIDEYYDLIEYMLTDIDI